MPVSVRAMSPAEVFARNFERIALHLGRHGECRVHRIPDTFDGRAFGPAEFATFAAPYLSNIAEFYRTNVDALSLRAGGAVPEGSERTTLVFESPYASGFAANDRVPFTWFRAKPPSRRVVALAPGWPRQDQKLEERIARRFVRRGIDVALLTVPFQLARTPQGAYSGEYFISSNPLWTLENFRQFVAEIRLTVRWLRDRYDSVGLLGLSSGGVHVGLAAHCEEVDFYVPVMSASDLGDLMWSSSITGEIRQELLARNVGKNELQTYWSPADIAHIGARLRAKHVLQIATRYDGIVPLEYQTRLWEALGRPDRTILPTSHFGIVFYADALADIAANFIEARLPLPARAA